MSKAIHNLEPLDEHNLRLIENVHPPNWKNPEPAPKYNLVVLGAGTAGLVAAAGAAGLGARVALVERHLMGGDCLNVGCVPSKALLRAARAAAEVRRAAQWGLSLASKPKVDFAAIMARVRSARAHISPHDSARRFTQEYGVDVFFGQARFIAADAVEVDGQVLRFQRAVIATGARPLVPPIPGLSEAGFYTNETIFNLTTLPKRLAVVGGGPIGCELAQAFARFGAEVTVVEMMDQLLPRQDEEAASLLAAVLREEGVTLHLGSRLQRVERKEVGITLHVERDGVTTQVEADAILVAVGRAPNVEGLQLEAAGIAYDRNGVRVDDTFRTTNPRVFAAGDVCSPYKFTHAADFMARAVVQNAFFAFAGKKRASRLLIPWCVYTDPEVAHVGLSPAQARERGVAVETFTLPLTSLDRAVLEGEEQGFVKIHVKKGSDRILGATVVCPRAGELIAELTVAMQAGLGLGFLASVIHPYPTFAENIRKAGDAYNRTRLTPAGKKLLQRFFSWRR